MGRGLIIVLLVALALRMLVIAATPDFGPAGDPADYDRIGASLATAGAYPPTTFANPGGPSAYRPPAYPLLLAAIYKTAGRRYNVVRAVGALLTTAAVALLYLLVARLWDRRLALWAAGVAAVAPPLVWLNGSLLSETLFLPLLLAMALLVALQRERGGLRLAAAAGAVLGLAVLTRSNSLVLALPLVVGLAHGAGGRRWAAPAVALACTALVMAPWAVRNADAFGRFLPLGTQGGYTLAGQWNAVAAAPGEFRAAWQVPEAVPQFQDLFHRPGLDEADVDAELRSRAIEYALDHPGTELAAIGLNTLRAFDLGPGHSFVAGVSYAEMGVPDDSVASLRGGTWLLLALAVAGIAVLVRARARPRGPVWLWLMPVLLLASFVPWAGGPRYNAGAHPFLAVLAAVAVLAMIDRRRAART